MKVAVFSAKAYDRAYLTEATQGSSHTFLFLEARLSLETVQLAQGSDAVCVFVNDCLDASIIQALAERNIRLVALRCAGYNNVDLKAAEAANIKVVRVPAYSPYAVAEHAVALMLDLNRKIHRAVNRVRESNFMLDGLMGFDMHGKTVGIIGTGTIGLLTAQILKGFGCRILAFDPYPSEDAIQSGITYVELPELLGQSDIISLHCPLTPKTYHMIDEETLKQMKSGVMLINTSRGAIIDTKAVVEALKSGKVGYLGLDVYEEEGDLFFEDLSSKILQDDVFSRLLTFPNVLITGHQAFFTHEAVSNIAETTLLNLDEFEQAKPLSNEVKFQEAVAV